VLVQYDSPDAILAHPADDFVAQFVGEDRALRRMALHTLAEVPLETVSRSETVSPELSSRVSVRTAVSHMLEAGTEGVTVVDDEGRVLGVFRLERAGELL
jgi:osmoprotectant transport system ATP-binding protein